jgi:hypothetical protein
MQIAAEDWKHEKAIEYAMVSPEHIFIRGTPINLREFFFAFTSSRGQGSWREFIYGYHKKFEALEQAEGENKPLGMPHAELNHGCERFYLHSRFDWEGNKIRPISLLDYCNKYGKKEGNFKDMQEQFQNALAKYREMGRVFEEGTKIKEVNLGGEGR